MAPVKPAARFIADCNGLDFLNSGNRSQSIELDWLASGERLISWLEQCGLVPREVLRQMRSNTEQKALDRVASRARELREWLRGFVNQRCGRPLVGVDISNLKLLNDILVGDEQYYQVVAPELDGSVLTLQSLRRWVAPESLLRPIAEAVAKLICETDFTQIRTCEGCSLMFVDRTRRQARKWCSMSTCGNRAKQAAHRSRRKPPPG
jgi:predicted RNA-binding Zn ribbon-like protein